MMTSAFAVLLSSFSSCCRRKCLERKCSKVVLKLLILLLVLPRKPFVNHLLLHRYQKEQHVLFLVYQLPPGCYGEDLIKENKERRFREKESFPFLSYPCLFTSLCVNVVLLIYCNSESVYAQKNRFSGNKQTNNSSLDSMLALVLLAIRLLQVASYDNGLAATPPMG
jgi:hypothetical protein